MHLFLRFVASAAALYLTVVIGHEIGLRLWLAPGAAGIEAAAIAAVVLGIVNAIIRPLIELVALPITCLTLGLFSIVINAVLFWAVGQVVNGFHVSGFLAALFGTVCMAVVGGLLNSLLISSREKARVTAK